MDDKRPDDAAGPQRTSSRWRSLGLPALTAFLPGALAGTQVAGLLFFLNPHLPFEPIPVLRGVAFFGTIVGVLTLLALLPFTFGRPGRALRWLPWNLSLVLAVSGAGSWIHASYYAFLLPSGINVRLLKAASWLSLAAVICFYTAIVHRLRHRPYGRRSWTLIAVLCLGSVYVTMERREAFESRPVPTPRATTYAGTPRPQLWVVGVEAATLDAILPLAEQERLPFFGRILEEGATARLRALHPTRRTPSWTTLSVGKFPSQHGVVSERTFAARFLGGRESLHLLPIGMGFEVWGVWTSGQPIDARARRSLALWEILSRLDIASTLVGWPLTALPPGTSPPRRVETGLSDRFFATGEVGGAIWPQELAERARLFRPRRADLDPDQTSRFGAKPPGIVLQALADDLWREELTFFLLEQDPQMEAFFVLLPGLEAVSERYFGGYSAVQLEGSHDGDAEEAAQLVAAYYAHLDDFLARLWERSRAPRLLAVVSVHGAEGPSPWTQLWHFLHLERTLEGRVDDGPDGVLMLLGEGVRPGARLTSAELVDLVPTLLYGLGFPIARDLDGAVLTDAFDTSFLARQPLTFLPSYETFAVPERGEGP